MCNQNSEAMATTTSCSVTQQPKIPSFLSTLNDLSTAIRLQLETLLAEKGRLAHENSVYARENRFLREIVEYHQLTMQDVVYVDEGIEEVSEVFSNSPNQILSRNSSVSNSSHAASTYLEHPTPAIPVPSTPTPTKPPAIVVSEACPIVPTPPTPSPLVTS